MDFTSINGRLALSTQHKLSEREGEQLMNWNSILTVVVVVLATLFVLWLVGVLELSRI